MQNSGCIFFTERGQPRLILEDSGGWVMAPGPHRAFLCLHCRREGAPKAEVGERQVAGKG